MTPLDQFNQNRKYEALNRAFQVMQDQYKVVSDWSIIGVVAMHKTGLILALEETACDECGCVDFYFWHSGECIHCGVAFDTPF